MFLHNKSLPNLLASITIILCTLVVPTANADITYEYTGNPFNQSNTTLFLNGDLLIASVTFSNPTITNSFSGDVYANSVSQWSISEAQQPSIQFLYTNPHLPSLPLWFHFDNGNITNWQLETLAALSPGSVFLGSNSSGDDAELIYPAYNSYNNEPGVWALATPIPAALWMCSSVLVGLFGFVCRMGRRKDGLNS